MPNYRLLELTASIHRHADSLKLFTSDKVKNKNKKLLIKESGGSVQDRLNGKIIKYKEKFTGTVKDLLKIL